MGKRKNTKIELDSDDQIALAAFLWDNTQPGIPHTECWEWKGGTSSFGHGRMKLDGKLISPHRLAYTLAYGEIPDSDEYHGMVVSHICDNPRCCRPSHLKLGTQKDNVIDMVNKNRHARQKKVPS